MNEAAHDRRSTHGGEATQDGGQRAPGKQTATASGGGGTARVQRRGRGGGGEAAEIHTSGAASSGAAGGAGDGAPRMGDWQMDGGLMAAMGISGAASPLPHGEAIQKSFGKHDVGGIQAHVGGAAAEASGAMGAEAYATGSHVAFAGEPSLHTAAHEAAHVVQQRGGVQLKGGVGQEGDPHEQHADAVADAVVAGRSAEPLLDAYAASGGSGSESGGGVQLKPVKRKGGGPRDFEDDLHPALRLIKEPESAEHEYRIKDRIQKVTWKDDSNYFTDPAKKTLLDLKTFEETREFGAFMETFAEASVLEQADDPGSEAAAMHLLQQFFSNALFNTQEVERFDYQASPLNYQVEHLYIRAAATSNADVLKAELLGNQGIDLETVYLASQMEFQDTMRQMFRAIQLAEAPTELNLRDPLDPLATRMTDHVAERFSKKAEFTKVNKEEEDRLRQELKTLTGQISSIEGPAKKQKRGDLADREDQEMFDWIKEKEAYTKAHKDLEEAPEKRAKLKTNIARQDEEIEKQKVAKQVQPPSLDPSSGGTATPPVGTPGGKKAPKPQDPAATKKILEAALSKLDDVVFQKLLDEQAVKLGLDKGALAQLKGLSVEAASARLEQLQLDKAKGNQTPFSQGFVRADELKQQRQQKQLELDAVAARRFELMRGFDKVFSGMVFLDFTAALATVKLPAVQSSVKDWGKLANEVLLKLVGAKLLAKNVDAKDVSKIIEELSKPKALGKVFFSGGMVDVDNNQLKSPALFLENNNPSLAVKTALGKSGYVPTPTSVNRQMVQSFPIKVIALGIIDKQLGRQPIDEATTAKLTQMRGIIEAFDPSKHEGTPAEDGQLAATQKAYAVFGQLAGHEDEHVGLMVRPVVQLFDNLRLLDGKVPFPAFALRQLETHLQDAVANAADIVALQRSVQNLHEFVIYGLELLPAEKDPAPLHLPDGAQDAHITHYGLNAFSHAFEAVLKQKRAGGGGEINIAALNNIYFEMMQKLGYTQGASGDGMKLAQPSSTKDLLAELAPSSGVTAKATAPDMIVLDIHPNDAAKPAIHENDVSGFLHQLFGAADESFRCTVLVDITLNHVSEDEVANIRNEARPYIASGQLNLVFNQSLTKFAQFGTDKHSGGLMFHYNDGAHWEAFNEHVASCAAKDSVDPTIAKYFRALFAHTEKENLDYLHKVRINSRYVYESLQAQLASIDCQEALTLAENDDPKTCYVAFNYDVFAAKVLGALADESEISQLAHDVLYDCIDALAGKLALPLNMRTSFGFPISNLGDVGPGFRLAVGIESPELLDQYVQLLTFANGALGREFDEHGAAKLKDPSTRQHFLREVTATIETLADLDTQVKLMQGGKSAARTNVPQPAPKKPVMPLHKPSLQGEKIDVGIGSVQHIQNSCYIASLLNLFAASPSYRTMIDQHRPPPQAVDGPPVVATPIQVLCQRLHAAIAILRTADGRVTDEMIREIRDSLRAMGWLQAPDVVIPKTGSDPSPSAKGSDPSPSAKGSDPSPSAKGSDPSPSAKGKDPSPSGGTPSPDVKPKASSAEALAAQQDAAEILQKFLGELTVPADMAVTEQGRKKQGLAVDFTDLDRSERQTVLSLPISAHGVTTLEGALKRYCAEENVVDFGRKLTLFKVLPRTLTISLKRFDFDGYGAAKNHRRIEVPQEFVMPDECLHPDFEDDAPRYRVVSFVEHSGGYGAGHYIAHGRRPDGSGYKNDDLQDGTRKETPQELDDSLARSYLYVFEQVDAL